MNRLYVGLLALACCSTSFAQEKPAPAKANYQLASKFSPEKLKKMIFSTSVTPNWINYSDRFWYEFATSKGKSWYLVDPAASKKELLFENSSLAAQITRIVKNPVDAEHLTLNNLKFTKDEKNVRFQVVSTKDTLKSKEEIEKLTNKSNTS